MSAAVTVAIPLYRSGRWVENIAENIGRLDYPDLAFVISDRHCEDDALERLAERFRGDARVSFRRAEDRAGWVRHYNDLLRACTTPYFLWMPHDDVYTAGYVSQLVGALEAAPDAVLAYGLTEKVFLPGAAKSRPFAVPAFSRERAWSCGDALRMLAMGDCGSPFRGVLRRERIAAAGLWIRDTRDSVWADIVWVFAVALLGRVLYVPDCVCRKTYSTGSVSAGWRRMGAGHRLSQGWVAATYVRDYVSGLGRKAAVWGMLGLWTVWRVMHPGSNRTYGAVADRLRGVTGRVLRGVR